jgi:RimJ/RimL family protein N-acetyltransferase
MRDPRRVRLTPLRDEDSDQLFQWINDRSLVILNAPFEPVTRSDHDRWFDSIRHRPDVAIFGIRLEGNDRLIGSCQLNQIDREQRTCQLQIRIGERDEWGRGYGTEAVGELLRYAFESLGMRQVGLQVFADNRRAIRTYENCGFKPRRVLRNRAVIEGERKDLLEMTVERDRVAVDGD